LIAAVHAASEWSNEIDRRDQFMSAFPQIQDSSGRENETTKPDGLPSCYRRLAEHDNGLNGCCQLAVMEAVRKMLQLKNTLL
jgi:hypothetical protein